VFFSATVLIVLASSLLMLLDAMLFVRGAIVADKCTYKTSQSKIELTLMKAQPQKWSTLEALTTLRKFISLFPL